MKKIKLVIIVLLLVPIIPLISRAQDAAVAEKHKAEAAATEAEKARAEAGTQEVTESTPLKIQVVFTDYDADKKVKSLPYVVYVNSFKKTRFDGDWLKLRIGSRVPFSGGKEGPQYLDVGTNIDAHSNRADDNRFILQLNLERSWVDGTATKSADISGVTGLPVLQQFKSTFNLIMRDGQTVESTMATDPVTGHILRVEITLNVIK